jgi:hypothetical protein
MKILAETKFEKGDPNHPLVIAYYTVDTPYEHEAEVLKLSLESIGYSYRVYGVPNLGSWQKNTQYKAEFIKEMLLRFSNQPLIYLDVDAVMVQAPKILDNLKADIAAVHFANSGELLSGTLFFGNTTNCKKVVDEWILLNKKYPETLPNGTEAWDQRTLKMAIKNIPGINFVELPQEYTWIVELTQRRCPESTSPVIMHTRGAKRFKNKINGEKGYAR